MPSALSTLFVASLFGASLVLGACADDASPADASAADASPAVDGGGDGSLVEIDGGPGADGHQDAPLTCPSFAAAEQAGVVGATAINEASGMVHSRKNTDVLWVHNDSGDVARVFAINAQGQLLGTYALQGANAIDWEDMALGSGPSADVDYLYLGDIGDNRELRPEVQVYRVAEPSVRADQAPVTETLQGVEAFTLSYPDGAHNAETLLVDPISGELMIITKSSAGRSLIFSTPIPAEGAGAVVMAQVGEIVFGEGALTEVLVGLATAGDISADGREILLRTYNKVIWWPRAAGQSVAQALAGEPCFLPTPTEQQGETIAFSSDGADYFTLSEGQSVPLYRFDRQ